MLTLEYIDIRPTTPAPRAPKFVSEQWSDDLLPETEDLQQRGWYPYMTLYGAGHRMEKWVFAAPAPLAIDLQSTIPTFDPAPVWKPSKVVPFYTARETEYYRQYTAQIAVAAQSTPTPQVAVQKDSPQPQAPALPQWAAKLGVDVAMLRGDQLQPHDEVYFGAHSMPVRLKAPNGENGRNQWGEYTGWEITVMYYGTDGGFFPGKRQINPNRWFVVSRKRAAASIASVQTAQGA